MARERTGAGRLIALIWRSFAVKFVLLLLIFLTVPIMLYTQFRMADAEKSALLLQTVQEQGRLVAEGVRPLLKSFEGKSPEIVSGALARFAGHRINVKVLFRPVKATGEKGFFFIASTPRVLGEDLEAERQELARTGAFDQLAGACKANSQSVTRYTNAQGIDEILTSITPIQLKSGCWVVVTALEMSDVLAASIGRPYWQTPQVRVAFLIYALMALITISLFLGLWRNLRRFGGVAREIRVDGDTRKSFLERNRIPELRDVAAEFDALVESLRRSISTIRQAAEENAHALKTPLAVIAQSIEPLRTAIVADNRRAGRALERIERSVERLDGLVSTVRRTDEAVAELINPPRERIDISALVSEIAEENAEIFKESGCSLNAQIVPGLHIMGGENLIEAIVQNIVDNAMTFSPRGACVSLSLRPSDNRVELKVMDEGPGVDPRNLESIFDRYVSIRQDSPDCTVAGAPAQAAGGHQVHFGIGLWVVRRNVEAMNGTIEARNRESGGFEITVRFPTA